MSQSQANAILGQDKRVSTALNNLGIGPWAWWHSEVRRLPTLIEPDESIGGVVYGYQGLNFVLLVATDRRVIFIDSKPLFTNEEEVTYDVVSGINFDHLIFTTITLRTRGKDYRLVSFNTRCALGFKRYIEQRAIEHSPS